MAVTYKDIDQLSQKATIAGTEKIPVSDTEYVTTSQIASLVEENVIETVKVNGTDLVPDANKAVDVPVPIVSDSLDKDSTDALQNGVATNTFLRGLAKVPTSTVKQRYFKTDGTIGTASTHYDYRIFEVAAGTHYAVSTHFGTGLSNGVLRVVLWLDSNDNVISYSTQCNELNSSKYFYDVIFVAPEGAVKAVVNYRNSSEWAGTLKEVAAPSPDVVVTSPRTFTSDEKAQARTNIGAANAEDIPNITISSSEPTSQDGNDGDIWIVV